MDLTEPDVASIDVDVARLQDAVRDATRVVPEGARTQWEVGGAPRAGTLVRAPVGVVRYEPADLTVTVAAGTPFEHLAAVLREHGQECPLDPRDARATVGGLLSAGLSGHRRLRLGPLRNWVLEVRFVTAEGRLVKGGGPTVKNVSGYDLPRLLVGSLGTIGVLTQVTLRAEPLPAASQWATTARPPSDVRAELFRPSSMLFDGRRTRVLLEGEPAEVEGAAPSGRAGAGGTARLAPRREPGSHLGRARPGRAAGRRAHECGCSVARGSGRRHGARRRRHPRDADGRPRGRGRARRLAAAGGRRSGTRSVRHPAAELRLAATGQGRIRPSRQDESRSHPRDRP